MYKIYDVFKEIVDIVESTIRMVDILTRRRFDISNLYNYLHFDTGRI